MDWTVTTYVVYLLVAVPLTIWVATTLSRNGRVFLEDVFAGNEGLADAVNRLLVVGFYLLNLGFVSSSCGSARRSSTSRAVRGAQRQDRRRELVTRRHPLPQRLRLQRDPPPHRIEALRTAPLPPQMQLTPPPARRRTRHEAHRPVRRRLPAVRPVPRLAGGATAAGAARAGAGRVGRGARRFPTLDHARTMEEITVVGDDGSVWTTGTPG